MVLEWPLGHLRDNHEVELSRSVALCEFDPGGITELLDRPLQPQRDVEVLGMILIELYAVRPFELLPAIVVGDDEPANDFFEDVHQPR